MQKLKILINLKFLISKSNFHFSKKIRSIGEGSEPWIKIKNTHQKIFSELYDEIDNNALSEFLSQGKEVAKKEQAEYKIDLPMSEIDRLKEENKKLKRAFSELYYSKFDNE